MSGGHLMEDFNNLGNNQVPESEQAPTENTQPPVQPEPTVQENNTVGGEPRKRVILL